MKLLIGLGNPGDQHDKTRHNLGFMVLDEYAKKHLGPKIIWELDNKFKSDILKIDKDLWLIKPQTYMNNSGLAIKLLTTYYKIPTTDVIIVHDELDLPLGKIKVRLGGAAAGHHGVESIIASLGTDQFIRVRLGIGVLKIHSAEKFVLEPFLHSEKAQVKHMIKQAIKALDILVKEGLVVAQNQYN